MPTNPPAHLGPDAAREWARIAGELERRGLWDDASAALVEGYAANYGRWVKAEGEIRKNGEVVKLPNHDKPIRNPWLDVAQDAQRLMRTFMADLKLVEKGRAPALAGEGAGDPVESRTLDAWFNVTKPADAAAATRRKRGH